MDKNAIKKYATWARRELISRVAQRAAIYEITKDYISDPEADVLNDKVLTSAEKKERKALIQEINKKGYEEVIEEVAYTWFNRFCALRFMEVNAYLPSYVRVFTDEENQFHPQILTEAIHLEIEGLDQEKVYELKEANEEEALYKYLIITQCNALNEILPKMFQKIDDYTELLFPDYLLREGSVIEQMIAMIPEEDWMDQVQIIGWLYQYYNSEKKDEVFAALKKKVKITKENIPAATQLFTPDWIVRYMVENSLGRLWIEGHPNEELKGQWKYYLDEAEQEPEVEKQLQDIRKEYETINPEDIKCIDPCCGSGHILSYLFDVLVQIYEAHGVQTRDAVKSIVEHNLYGLDIDDRAAQLAYFSVMMKGRQYDRRFFRRGVQPHVYAIVESNDVSEYVVEYFCNGDEKLKIAMDMILAEMYDAKEYGSILNITEQDWNALEQRFDEIREDISFYQNEIIEDVKPLVEVAKVLGQKYDVVVTNPPYMGAGNMNAKLNKFIKDNYANYKSDFFSAFMVKCSKITKQRGYLGFLTPYVWMFIQSYEKLREYLYRMTTIETLIQFEYSAFEEATVPICTFVFKNSYVNKKGKYLRLTEFRGGMEIQRQKTLEAIENYDCDFCYEKEIKQYAKIPGKPVAYWASNSFLRIFDAKDTIGTEADAKKGLTTSEDATFLRLWYEVGWKNIYFNAESKEGAAISGRTWFPLNKGGEFRRWYGNNEYVINWYDNGKKLRDFNKSVIRNEEYYFREAISWNDITSGLVSFRFKPLGQIFNDAGPSIFADRKTLNYLLALGNSKIMQEICLFITPTIHYTVGQISNVPVLYPNEKYITEHVITISKNNILLSKSDWNSFENSWDFQQHPLVKLRLSGVCVCGDKLSVMRISSAYKAWEIECDTRFNRLKQNEEELNRIFIDIYGLQGELTPEVEDKDITVRKVDLGRDIRSFISYAVGCMFGRYSLDQEGLIYAGGEWNPEQYKTFPADKDNIIPICDDEYFEDDIVGLFIQFVKTVYGEETLEENLKFIADALGGKGSPKEVIRNYFIKDFYKDHCKIYQKRPIYWLFDSGKKNGFKALIYMHRYQPDTIARIRTDYVHQQQSRYRTALEDLERRMEDADTRERVKLNKKLKTLKNQMDEIHEYEEKIHHLADQMISIDLDDGVKKNYAKFQEVLAKIK